ncbi:phosphodiester glycosidase family protein [cf. Phormidesmis sp. LEGE 11477]|uniref:phosphodiester glycosidase family protein n=1 Tax=cf. Phormidesmis sp. LEGE 11477 TaxID=1828680 RepID=UPI00187ED588|nr:phosphodiester glycosidase family protein [cf. Phormidesmis sp. LEGE 11477]MBE9060037.1 phosphodiester glycosidase family protein [cf. Phormidesmis sp. LEGE 11477]
MHPKPSKSNATHQLSTDLSPSGRLPIKRVVSFGFLTVMGWAVVTSFGVDLPRSLTSLSNFLVARTNGPEAAEAGTHSSHLTPFQSFKLPSFRPAAKANTASRLSGNRIRVNGHTLTGFWQQKDGRIGISSQAMASLVGVELMSTTVESQQPVRWFPTTQDSVINLPAWWDATDRYLDITDLAVASGWTQQIAGNTLQLAMPQSQTTGIRQGKQTWGDRIVVDLSGPATWRMDSSSGYTITVTGNISQDLVSAFKAKPGNLLTQLDVAPLNGQTILKIKTKGGASPQIWTTGNPARIVIDIRRDPMVERDVAWAPGLRWRQQYVNVNQHRFPVYMFIARPSSGALTLRPIHAADNTAIGIEPILSTAQRTRAIGAVNAGFFNRNNQLPLGAVRSAGQWISGPILGRGAMAWNDSGELVMDRFTLSESVTTGVGEAFPILAVNSGYVKAGIGRYTEGWGSTYTPIVDNEIIVTVQNHEVVAQQSMGKAGSSSVPIPRDGGYLLALRSYRTAGQSFQPGTPVLLSSQSQPAVFEQYPNIIGGGPLLVRDRNIVLNPQLEGFSTNFIQGAAPRTAVGKTADGTWIIATMHDRVGGRGPTLTETAYIMKQLGAVDALNLDGGSSSSLYLGGQLLNRHPRTAARVNNGIGLFVSGEN